VSENCEGSERLGYPAVCPPTHGLCSVCDAVMHLNDDGSIPPHQRYMLDRTRDAGNT
jgi:hypothetical protein